MKQFYTLFFALIIGLNLSAQPSANYYNAAEGKSEATLKTALHNIISGHTDKGYGFLYTIFETSDRTAAGQVWDMYSTCTWYFGSGTCGNYKNVCDCYNREHTVPQSWFSERAPMVSDAYHIYPTDGKVNGIRSNDPYGETNASVIGGKALGKSGSSSFPGYTGKVFEPIDEYKGDLARTYFYFATRYEDIMTTIGGASFNKTKYPSFPTWTVNLLLKWHREDPVSQKEIDRNDAVAYYQRNRNPFIDYPELAEYIWGNKKGAAWYKNASTAPAILLPVNNSTIEFGQIPYQENSAVVIDIRAANLTGAINLSLSGAQASQFSLAKTSFSKAEAEAGAKLTINCTPQSLGLLSALLTVSGGGVTTHTVNLSATSADSFMASEATNIGSAGFTANWTLSAGATGYQLDVYKYIVTGTTAETLLEEDFTNNTGEDPPAGWDKGANSYIVTSNGEIRLASNTRDGELITPPIDLSDITILTIRAKSYGANDNSTIKISINGEPFETITTGANYQVFEIELPEFDIDSQISFFAESGKRVYINYIEVRTEGSIAEKEQISSYPKSVGNVLSYSVGGLDADTQYFYTVTPQGNGALTSNEVEVRTKPGSTGLESNMAEMLMLYQAGEMLYISNMESGTQISVYNVLGEKLLEIEAGSDQIGIPLARRAVYIVQVTKENSIVGTRKVLFN